MAIRKSPHRPRRVLVVDDDQDTAEIFAALIESMQHSVTYVTEPTEALQIAMAFRPEIAFLDLAMPNPNGYALAKLFRATPELSAVVLVAISGHAQLEDRQRSRQAGFDAHVGKPLDAVLLEAILAQLG